MKKYLYIHTSPETAFIVQNYPWGFRLRTTIRYWIETKIAKNGGQRFAYQTVNPKTNRWCATKYSTYSPLMVMYLDENEHVKCETLNEYSNEKLILEFKETHWENLTSYQKDRLKWLLAHTRIISKIPVTIGELAKGESKSNSVSLFSDDPEEIEKRKELFSKINKAIINEKNKIE